MLDFDGDFDGDFAKQNDDFMGMFIDLRHPNRVISLGSSEHFWELLKAKGAWSFDGFGIKKPVILDGDLMWDTTCFFCCMNGIHLKHWIFEEWDFSWDDTS